MDAETGNFDVLDFEDEDMAVSCSEQKSKTMSDHQKATAELENSFEDEGELKSDEDSGLEEQNSSEEGEVQSEIEELDPETEKSPTRTETPWERGLRLAREKREKIKALKAAEKDFAEKRMTLSVNAPVVDEAAEEDSRDDVFWLCYYQASIIGRTELTCHRFLQDDLHPPSATQLTDWRLGLSTERRGRRRQRHRRGSSDTPSSSGSSSSRASSVGSASDVSSLGSVAASWKATCARAMKDYLSSPIRNKDRRRRSSSISSGSDSASGSSVSRSGSEQSRGRGSYHRSGAANAAVHNGRPGWSGAKGRVRSGSEHSSASRSASGSSRASSGGRGAYPRWKYGSRRATEDMSDWQEAGEADSPTSKRPPLPNERPVKRPWVAAPGLANTVKRGTGKGPRTGSSDQSHHSSPSGSPAPDERRFITSWSKSPSSGDESHQFRGRRPVRRERLPDVVPGAHPSRTRHPVTPSVRHRMPGSNYPEQSAPVSRYEDGDISGFPLTLPPNLPRIPSPPPPPPLPTFSHSQPDFQQQPQAPLPRYQQPERQQSSQSATSVPPSSAGGELPSNRPGVRMTLAPRLKASAVDMTNIPGGVTRGVRANQPSPPRLPRLPFPLVPTMARGQSPVAPEQQASMTNQSEIRRQAEAAAAIVEARERRRAAAEAARRKRNPKKKKDDLSKIPIRGRPTYRRQSFSDSSGGSSRSKSSARSGSDSRSPSGTPEPNIIMNPDYITPHTSKQHRRRTKTEVAPPMMYEETPVDHSQHRSLHGEQNVAYQSLERKKYAAKAGVDTSLKYRKERQQPTMDSYAQRMQQPFPKQSYDPYEEKSGYAMMGSRRRDARPDAPVRYPEAYEEHLMRGRRLDNHRTPYDMDAMDQTQTMRPPLRRPRTPHAEMNFGAAFGVQSPHISGMQRSHKTDRKRALERDDFAAYDQPPSRKRAVLVESEEAQAMESRRAIRSRHRSRGPGAPPIDRSEPFESDSSAAEQRLRELRERLNLVDDAIAEIKAGSTGGGNCYTSRR